MIQKILLTFFALCATFSPLGFAIAQEQPLSDVGSYSEDALSARLTALRETYRIKLSDSEKERIISRCEQAQSSLRRISDKLTNTKATRDQTYDAIVGWLINLRSLVVLKQIDASNVDLLIVEYQQKKLSFDSAVSDYQVSLDDTIRVDCKAKPEEFRAALEGVRAERTIVVATSAQLEEVTKSNLKTAFDTLKSRLQMEDEKSGE